MRTLILIVAMTFAVVMLPLLAVASLMLPLVPYLLAGVLLSAALHRRRRAAIASRSVARVSPHRAPPLPRPAAGGWVYVPVWVAPPPRPAPTVVEGQVVERRDG